jgi:hypothetical protein
MGVEKESMLFSNLFSDPLIRATDRALYYPVSSWYSGAKSAGKHTKNQRLFSHPSSAGSRLVATPDKTVDSRAECEQVAILLSHNVVDGF